MPHLYSHRFSLRNYLLTKACDNVITQEICVYMCVCTREGVCACTHGTPSTTLLFGSVRGMLGHIGMANGISENLSAGPADICHLPSLVGDPDVTVSHSTV